MRTEAVKKLTESEFIDLLQRPHLWAFYQSMEPGFNTGSVIHVVTAKYCDSSRIVTRKIDWATGGYGVPDPDGDVIVIGIQVVDDYDGRPIGEANTEQLVREYAAPEFYGTYTSGAARMDER